MKVKKTEWLRVPFSLEVYVSTVAFGVMVWGS